MPEESGVTAAPAVDSKNALQSQPHEVDTKPDGALDAPEGSTVEEPKLNADAKSADNEDMEDEEAAMSKETEEMLTADGAEDDVADGPVTEEGIQADTGNVSAEDMDTTKDESAMATPGSSVKSKGRRKSTGVPEHKNKKSQKNKSKATNPPVNAKPGDHFYIRLKGYPLWPGIICDEEMLPKQLFDYRPVSSARQDGTYREDYQDGGKKVLDRTFPVMYLHTNEFGWIPNRDLIELDFDNIVVPTKARKGLAEAHELAKERNNLDHYKQVLREFEEARVKEAEDKAAAKEASKAAAATKKGGKGKRKSTGDGDEEDVSMVDVITEDDGEDSKPEKPKSSKKRKASGNGDDLNATPSRADSIKKPKIKLNTSSTTKANGADTPKSSVKKEPKPKTPKVKKPANNGTNGDSAATPKEPELSPEEKRLKKEKEILFLRHKLQKGLLTRDQQPKEDEMRQMSEYVVKLEGYADLEVSIIRATKINKVLKAILKLDEIPKESEFKFKDRSQTLLEKWNKILENDAPPATGGLAHVIANGADSKELANGTSKLEDADSKEEDLAKSTNEASASDALMADNPVEAETKTEGTVEAIESSVEKPLDDNVEAEIAT